MKACWIAGIDDNQKDEGVLSLVTCLSLDACLGSSCFRRMRFALSVNAASACCLSCHGEALWEAVHLPLPACQIAA